MHEHLAVTALNEETVARESLSYLLENVDERTKPQHSLFARMGLAQAGDEEQRDIALYEASRLDALVLPGWKASLGGGFHHFD